MIVVDTNVLAYLYLPTEFTTHAEGLFERDSDWVAPLLWRSEYRNILTGYFRRGVLTFEQALAMQTEAEDLLRGNEREVDSPRVFELVRDSNCSAYDCEFAALAMSLGVKLVTMDRKLLNAFPAHAIALDRIGTRD